MQRHKSIRIIIGAMLFFGLVYWLADHMLPLDFSQDYRKVEGSENIVFAGRGNGWDDWFYKRSFWGLKKDREMQKEDQDNVRKSDASLELLKEMIRTDNEISQAVYSPDKRYILYRETQYGYTGSGVTDDEYCYYRVYEIESGEIITIYQGYREWYHLVWNDEMEL